MDCPKLLKLIVPESKWTRMPFLDDMENGATNYLDSVPFCSFTNGATALRGVDEWKRPFLTFSVSVDVLSDPEMETRHEIYTIFQRYSDSDKVWVVCASHLPESRILEIPLGGVTRVHEGNIGPFRDLFANPEGIEVSYNAWNFEAEDFSKVVKIRAKLCHPPANDQPQRGSTEKVCS